jgi:TetR/AcrR family transcriptional regulator
MSDRKRGQRKQEILQALAQQLEQNPGDRITTAALARAVGVSEAALYRHFPSKAKMYEALFDFTEEALFGRVARILEVSSDAAEQCEQIALLVLGFAAKNPGITRLLTGDALVGETQRLRQRGMQIFNRLESQIKQILRESQLQQGVRARVAPALGAGMLVAMVQGRLQQYVMSGFQRLPDSDASAQWQLLHSALFSKP